MTTFKNYTTASDKISIGKDCHFRLNLIYAAAALYLLSGIAVILIFTLDRTRFTERALTLGIPLAVGITLLLEAILVFGIFYIKRKSKEVLVITKEGAHIEGSKKSQSMAKETIARIEFLGAFPLNSNPAPKSRILITSRLGDSLYFTDIAVPFEDCDALEKAIDEMLGFSSRH